MSDGTIPWTAKYAPHSAIEVMGQDAAVEGIRKYIENYAKQKKKGMLVYGPPGCGKTSTLHALARDLQLEVVEINASDYRNKDAIESIVGSASGQMSLFGKSKVILIDEVDGLAGNKDRGGVQALIRILKKSRFPMIMTCNDPYGKKLKALRKECEILSFEPLKYTDVTVALKLICEQEMIRYDESALKQLARESAGDLRAAVNDLQTICGTKKHLTMDDLDILGERIKKESLSEALVKVFKMSDPVVASQALFNVDETIDTQIMWIDENLPREYMGAAERARGFDSLSRADVFMGRIRRWQYWRFMATAGSHLSTGIAVAKDERNPNHITYQQPARILEMWKANMFNQKKKAIAEKLAVHCHVSKKRARNDVLPYVRTMCKHDAKLCDYFTRALDLSSDEVAWLKK